MAGGYYKTAIRVKKDAAPIDNITKFAWDDDDYEQVEEWVEYTKEEVEERKQYYIDVSKSKLSEYLESNPLLSSCHNNTEAFYSITKEKQNLLLQNYSSYTIKKQNGLEAVLTWNATGEVCEEWTENELLQLIAEMDAVVKPLITQQQKYEKDIVICEDLSVIEKMDFDYSVADIRKQNTESKEI